MTLPVGLVTVTVTGSEFGGDGAAKGSVDFRLGRVLYAALNQIGLATTYRAKMVAGAISIALPADPSGNPSGGTIHVTERCEGGKSYDILLDPANGPVQDLSSLAPVTSSTGTPVVVGPVGPRGYDAVVAIEHGDGSATLITANPANLTDNLDGTATLELESLP